MDINLLDFAAPCTQRLPVGEKQTPDGEQDVADDVFKRLAPPPKAVKRASSSHKGDAAERTTFESQATDGPGPTCGKPPDADAVEAGEAEEPTRRRKVVLADPQEDFPSDSTAESGAQKVARPKNSKPQFQLGVSKLAPPPTFST